MADTPPIYDELQRMLNTMGKGGYTVEEDKNFSNRVFVTNSMTKKRMALNLTNEETKGVGRVWLVGSDSGEQNKLITPHINADYEAVVGNEDDSTTATINYSAESSTQRLARMLYQSFGYAGKTGDPKEAFNRILSEGDPEIGFKPAPSIPQGWKATQDMNIGQIGFSVTTNGDRVNPDEANAIYEDFIYNYGNAKNPNLKHTIKAISNDEGLADSKPITFETLNEGHYQFNDHGRLVPMFNASPEDIQTTGQWLLTKDPKRVGKSQSLSSGSDPIKPYTIETIPVYDERTGKDRQTPIGVRELKPKATTETNRPSYAISNVLMPGESEGRGYERHTMLYGPTPVPGAAIAYNNKYAVKEADAWGKKKVQKAKLASFDMKKVLAGEQTINIENYQGRQHGGGKEISVFGQIQNKGEEPEDIKTRFGPGTWRSTGSHELVLPKFYNPSTNKFSQSQEKGFFETEGFFGKEIKDEKGNHVKYEGGLQDMLPGMKLKVGRADTPYLRFAGMNESSSAMKGLDDKSVEIPTGLDQEINGVSISRWTGELKGNSWLYGYFGGLNYKQLQGLAQDWQKNGNELGGRISSYLEKNALEAAQKGRELNLDFGAMSKEIGYEGGGQGLGLMVDWFGGTIRAAKKDGKLSSRANARNLKLYGAGYATSGKAQLGLVHTEQLQELKENWVRAQMENGLTEKQAVASFKKRFNAEPARITDGNAAMYEVTQNIGPKDNYMIVEQLKARRSENIHGPRMAQEWLQAVTQQYPAFATAIGANVDTFKPQGATQAAAAGILKYAMWQSDRNEFLKDKTGGLDENMPENIKEISDETLSNIQAHLSTFAEGESPIDKLRSVVDQYFPKDKDGINADSLLFNKKLGVFLPNPRAILNSTFQELGVEAAGLARPMVNAFSQLGGLAMNKNLRDEDRRELAVQATDPLLKRSKELITGSGEFMKRLLGTNIATAASGRYRGALNLGHGEVHIPFDMALAIAKRNGLSGHKAIQAARGIMNSGASAVAARQPMLATAVNSYNLIREQEYAQRFLTPEAYEKVRQDPLFRGMVDMPVSQGRAEAGDFDADPISMALGLAKVGDEFKAIEDPMVRADVMTKEKIDLLEDMYMPNKSMANMVNASVQQLMDYGAAGNKGKDKVGATLDQKALYSPEKSIRSSVERLMNKTLGMGVGYNMRRAVGGAMSAMGYSSKEMANVLSSVAANYQPALDTSLTGRESAGTKAAALLAKTYFHQQDQYDEEGKPTGEKRNMWRMSTTGEKDRNGNTRIANWEYDKRKGEYVQRGWRILPNIASPKFDVDIEKLFTDDQEILNAGAQITSNFAAGFNMKGKNVSMSERQFAGWVAAPGDTDMLEEKLKKTDRNAWPSVAMTYQRGLLQKVEEENMHLGSKAAKQRAREAVLSTPAFQAPLVRAWAKAKDNLDRKGNEKIPGAMAVARRVSELASPEFINRLTTGYAIHGVEHRFKGIVKFPSVKDVRTAAEQMGPDVKGVAFRTFTRISDIAFNAMKKASSPFGKAADQMDEMTEYGVTFRELKEYRELLTDGGRKGGKAGIDRLRELETKMQDARNSKGDDPNFDVNMNTQEEIAFGPEPASNTESVHSMTQEDRENTDRALRSGPPASQMPEEPGAPSRDAVQEPAPREFTDEEADALEQSINDKDVAAKKLGSSAYPNYTQDELAYLQKNDPEVYNKAIKFKQAAEGYKEQADHTPKRARKLEHAIADAYSPRPDVTPTFDLVQKSEKDLKIMLQRHGSDVTPGEMAKMDKKQLASAVQNAQMQQWEAAQQYSSQTLGESPLESRKHLLSRPEASLDKYINKYGAPYGLNTKDMKNKRAKVRAVRQIQAAHRLEQSPSQDMWEDAKRATITDANASTAPDPEYGDIGDRDIQEPETPPPSWEEQTLARPSSTPSTQGTTSTQAPSDASAPDPSTGGSSGGGQPPSNNQPPSNTPPDDPGDGGGGDPVDPGKRVPRSKKDEHERKKRGMMPKAHAMKIRGIYERTQQYTHRPRMLPYMYEVMKKFGYKGEEKAGPVREFFDEIMRGKKRTEVLSKLDPDMMNQMYDLAELQEQGNLALATIDNTPGLSKDAGEIKKFLNQTVGDPTSDVGQDIQAFGHVATMIPRAERPKNNFMLSSAADFVKEDRTKDVYKDIRHLVSRGGKGVNRKVINELRGMMVDNPDIAEVLSTSEAIGKSEHWKNLPPELQQMGKFAKAVNTREPGLLKPDTMMLGGTTDEITKLTEAYKRQADAAKKLKDIQDGVTQGDERKAAFESRKASAAYEQQLYGKLAQGEQRKIERLQTKFADTGNLTEKEAKRLELASNRYEAYTTKGMKAQQDSAAIQTEEEAGPFGGFARRMLGGFGLMYMKSIFGLATSGLGYGTDERLKYNQIQQQNIYATTGEKNVQSNQDQILANKMALAGSNYNAISGVRQVFADAPIAREAYNMGAAGLGAWGYSQFAASQLPVDSKVGKFLTKNSVGIGMAAAGVATLADSYARSQDPVSLGQRMASGQLSLNDHLGYGIAQLSGRGAEVERSRAGMALVRAGAERGLTFEQMGNTEVDFISKVGKFGPMQTGNMERTKDLGKNIFTKGEMFANANAYLLQQNTNLSQEAVAQATGFAMRNNMKINDQRITSVAEDYQFGGWGAQTAQATLGAAGYNAAQMYSRKPGEEFDKLGSLQMKLATGTYDDAQKALLAQGTQMLGQLPGAKYIEGVGSKSKTPVTEETMMKFVEQLGRLAGTSAGETYMAEQGAAEASRKAGIKYRAPDINDFFSYTEDERGRKVYDYTKPIELSPAEATKRQEMAQVQAQTAASFTGNATNFALSASRIGQTGLAERGYDFLTQGDPGQQWKRQRLLQGDPMQLAAAAARGVNLSQLAGPVDIQGNQMNANVLANTDIGMDGRLTGLGWGTTSLQRGSISAVQMGQQIFGGMNNAGTQAMIQGVKLPQPITTPGGRTVTEVGGTMGLMVAQNAEEDRYQEQMFGFQSAAQQRDYDYQMAVWGIQDKQRALSHQQTLSGFKFQELGMGLQQQQINMNDRFFWQNSALQQQQTTMQRGWTRQDWAIDDNTRAMQWEWKTEDFQEERRFMTGRQRRLAERQMERDTTMHGVQEDKVSRDKNRQQELWKLEDARFDLQKSQHTEQIKMQQDQLNLQKKQFEENKKFYFEGKKLEDEMIKLQRAHWLEEHNASKQQLALSREHQKVMLELKKANDQFQIAAQLANGELNTLAEDSMVKFQESIIALAEKLGLLAEQSSNTSTPNYSGTGAPGAYYPPAATTTTTPSSGGIVVANSNPYTRAGGGPTYQSMTNVLKVGEEGFEYIINGEVIPHDKSVELEQQGIIPGSSVGKAQAKTTDTSFDVSSMTPQTFTSTTSSPMQQQKQPTVIVLNVGNEELRRFVVNSFGEEF